MAKKEESIQYYTKQWENAVHKISVLSKTDKNFSSMRKVKEAIDLVGIFDRYDIIKLVLTLESIMKLKQFWNLNSQVNKEKLLNLDVKIFLLTISRSWSTI